MGEWIAQGDGSATVFEPEGNGVTVLFASDAATLGMLETAVG